MKIDEAIKVLANGDPVLTPDEVSIFDEAIALSIEALEKIKSFRTNMGSQKFWKLPSETI